MTAPTLTRRSEKREDRTDWRRMLRGANNEGMLLLSLVGLVLVTSIANPSFSASRRCSRSCATASSR